MATAAPRSLRDRPSPPFPSRVDGTPRAPGIARALTLASLLFGVAEVALVLATPDGFRVTGVVGACAEAARAAACRLFEALAASAFDPASGGAGVLEEVTPKDGFVAAAPVMSAGDRCIGAICLLDPTRLGLLSEFQRRLLAEIGGLLGSRTDVRRGVRPLGDALRRAADLEPDAFALFDRDGRCVLRNCRFDGLLDVAFPSSAAGSEGDEALGREASWIAARLMRDRAPVAVYRAALPDGAWLNVEERRGAHGRSLIARLEDGGFGDAEAQLLFERCPLPMFVFDADTRGILAANAAALSLYGWEREAFLRLDVDAIGPLPRCGVAQGGLPEAGETWSHRTRDGRALALTGRATALVHRGRPAVLVTVSAPTLVRAA